MTQFDLLTYLLNSYVDMLTIRHFAMLLTYLRWSFSLQCG